jgi:hypothetical protein
VSAFQIPRSQATLDRVLVRPEPLGHRAVDDHDRLAARIVGRLKCAPSTSGMFIVVKARRHVPLIDDQRLAWRA